jgi:hypothetical protein
MEFVLDAKIYDDERKRHLTAIFLTRYYNLSSCQTPEDPRWRSHLPVSAFKKPSSGYPTSPYGGGQTSDYSQWEQHYPAPFIDPSPAGTLQRIFEEAGGGLSLEDLTMANERKILAGETPEDSKYISYI